MSEKRETWLTTDEIAFVRGLGRFRWIGRKQQLLEETSGRLQALRKYLAAARRRDYWGDVDRAEVIGAVLLEIANETKRGLYK
jgi:hypothetical protein